MGRPRTVSMSAAVDEPEKQNKSNQPESSEASEEKAPRRARLEGRSKKYISVRSKVDKTKNYPLEKALELLKKISYTKFDSSISADITLKDSKLNSEITFPYSTGKTKKIALASAELISQIDSGNIDFDILISTPEFMPQLAKHARTLGPKGLMPNPKNGTVTDDPEKKMKELKGGKTQLKTEKKAPLIHQVIGKTSQNPDEIKANALALIEGIGGRKMLKFVLSSTMSPGIKVDLTPYQQS